MTDVDVATEARKFALQNAVEHGGQAQPGAVVGRLMGQHADLRDRADEVQEIVADVVAEVNAMDPADQQAALSDLAPDLLPTDEEGEAGQGLPDLPNVGEEVVMRFAPNPNGAPTIGHARGMVVNGEYVDRYGGTLILRYDDTDPATKAPLMEAYEWFAEDWAWLGYEPDLVFACSDRLDMYHEHARTMLARGQAYVCSCPQDRFQVHRKEGTACEHRDGDPGGHVEAFDGMMLGETAPGEAVVRIKTDMGHRDPALRDWVALRVIDVDEHPHPRTGSEHRVWPMLDFASAIEDHKRGVTHIIRGKDLRDSTGRQRFLYDHFGWTYPETLYWGRVRIHEGEKFSTSTIAEGIAEGRFDGWDDPRLPTLRALARRGYQAEAVRTFWVDQGLTEKDVAMSWKNVDAVNRDVVDPVADRYFFVHDPVAWTLRDAAAFEVEAPLHPDDPDRGFRRVRPDGDEVVVHLAAADSDGLSPGDALRLKDFCNVRVEDGVLVAEDDDLDRIRDEDLAIVHFVLGDGVPARVLRPDGSVHEGRCEEAVPGASPDDVVQFERYGFCRLEEVSDDGVVALFAHK